MGRLDGRTALITGGAGGIGTATARVFAREGARLVLVDLDEAGLERAAAALVADGLAADGDVMTCRGDAACEQEVAAYVAAAVERFGRVDVLYNLAGILGELVPLHEQTEQQFDELMRVNAKGAWLNLKHVARAMRADGGGGSIVNANANLALGAMASFGAYIASQHAIVGLTRTAAIELAPDGIRVNAVMIGPTNAPMARAAVAALLPGTEMPPPPLPLARRADPVETAEVVAFLASDAASFVTGAAVPVDGGWSAR